MSEASRIAELTALFGAATGRVVVAPGDDAAVVRPGGGVSVTSVDSIVEHVDFVRPTFPMRAIGRKAVAAALSDLAAMAATPGEVYVAAGVPAGVSDAEFADLTAGIDDAAAAAGAIVCGGDLSGAGELWLSVTVVGYAADHSALLTRSGARPDDVVAVTGTLGASAAAVAGLTGRIELEAGVLQRAAERQFSPQPRIAAARALADVGASALIDVSDGVATDAGHLARAGRVRIDIELAAIPADPDGALGAVAIGEDPQVFAAASGEEYELLVTLPAGSFAAARDAVIATGTELTRIGVVLEGEGARLLDAAGEPVEVRGYQHFD